MAEGAESSDVGACQMIIDGKIKVKSGTQIERFTPKGLKFADGSKLEADVVLYATGYILLFLFRITSY